MLTAGEERTGAARVAGWLQRPVVAGLALLVVYVGLSFLMSPRGYLGTDTGGKVATLQVMADNGRFDPDVGYWARAWDPAGELHGLYYTSVVDGKYVNVTTLPMLYAGEPLYRIGGYRLALLLPMLGSVAAAFAARALARRIADTDGWAAFWIVGLASPLAIYALDFWEHSIGVALIAWGVVALLDALERGGRWWRGGLAGLAFGAAFTMRTEALVYGFVAVGTVAVVLLVRRRNLVGPLVLGASAVVGMAVVVGANALLESATMGATFRAGRATGTAGAGGSGLSIRLKEAVVTGGGVFPSADTAAYVLGGALVALLCLVAFRTSRPGDRTVARFAAAGVVVLYVLRLADGLGFVPGMVATTPFVAAGIVLGWKRSNAAVVAAIGLLALPLVWVFQFTGGAVPQWGGRYVLASGLLLGVVGVAGMDRLDRWARVLFIALAVAVTGFGLGWLSVRSHQVADAAAAVQARSEPVIVSRVPFWLRELGAVYPDSHWLSVDNGEKLARAGEIVRDAGYDRFALLSFGDQGDDPVVAGFTPVAEETVDWLDVPFRIVTYQASS